MNPYTLAILIISARTSLVHSLPSCDIRDYGAVGDNKTLNTQAIISTIGDCHSKYGNETLVAINISDGIYITGSFNITSNTIIYLNNNATIAGSTNPIDYPLCLCYPECSTPMYCPLIGSFNSHNIAILGEDNYDLHNPYLSLSNIDGRGAPWWSNYSNNLLKHQRPKLIEFINCTNINIHNITVFNSSFWTIHPIFSSNINISYINVFAPRSIGNTDGIDPDSCQNVFISNVWIDVGDDGIAIKSAPDITDYSFKYPNYTNLETKNILIEDITILSRNFGIGGTVINGVSNVTFRNSIIGDKLGSSPWAIKIKTHRGQGGFVKDILFENITFGAIEPNNWQQPNGGIDIIFTPDYGSSNEALYPAATVNNVIFRNINGYKSITAGDLSGLNESIWNVTFENVNLSNSDHGWNCKYINVVQIGQIFPSMPSTC